MGVFGASGGTGCRNGHRLAPCSRTQPSDARHHTLVPMRRSVRFLCSLC